jgi:uncharacterized protein with ParB-like and HNH nuclease domain
MGLQPPITPVGDLLKNNVLYIPDYQREYAWRKDIEVDDYWNDLKDIIKTDATERPYFFGQIVIHDDSQSKRRTVIDGQQRLCTSLIFIAALRKILLDIFSLGTDILPIIYAIGDIERNYLGIKSDANPEVRFRLHLRNADNSFFHDIILTGELPIDKKWRYKGSSQKRLGEAYLYFYQKIREAVSKRALIVDKQKYLLKLLRASADIFQVLVITANDIDDAYILFETINSRGKDLEASDLIKNYFFSKSHQVDTIIQYWDTVLTLVPDNVTVFLRYYWNSKYAFVRKSTLFKSVRGTLSSSDECIAVIKEISYAAEIYSYLESPGSKSLFKSKSIDYCVNSLHTYGATIFYPLAIAMYISGVSESDQEDVYQCIERFVFKNVIISGRLTNEYEEWFSQIARELSSGNILSPRGVIKSIRDRTVREDEFKESFIRFETKTPDIARHILKAIWYWNNRGGLLDITKDNSIANLEHIMPQTLSDDWLGYESIHAEYLYRIGNMTILESPLNKQAQNRSFEYKKTFYQNSDFKMTKDLSNYSEWSKEVIKERQESFYNIACRIWQ